MCLIYCAMRRRRNAESSQTLGTSAVTTSNQGTSAFTTDATNMLDQHRLDGVDNKGLMSLTAYVKHAVRKIKNKARKKRQENSNKEYQ